MNKPKGKSNRDEGLTTGELFLARFLANRYNEEEIKFRAMIRSGEFSKKVIEYAHVFEQYTFIFDKTKSVSRAVTQTAQKMNISERKVYRAINRFK